MANQLRNAIEHQLSPFVKKGQVMTYHLAQMSELIPMAEFMEAQLTFGEWVIDQIESSGMQQKEFAALVGVDPSTVSKWKKNENLPRGTTCDQIAAVLDLDRNEVRARAGRTQVQVTRAVTWNVEANATQGQSAGASADVVKGSTRLDASTRMRVGNPLLDIVAENMQQMTPVQRERLIRALLADMTPEQRRKALEGIDTSEER